MDEDEREYQDDPDRPKVAGRPDQELVIILAKIPNSSQVSSVRFHRKYVRRLALDMLDMADLVDPENRET